MSSDEEDVENLGRYLIHRRKELSPEVNELKRLVAIRHSITLFYLFMIATLQEVGYCIRDLVQGRGHEG